MEKVLVTGANGHLGFSLVKALQQRGYAVRAGVRDCGDEKKAAALSRLGVDVVQADLMLPQTLDSALQGMDGLFQVAAVFDLTSDNPQRDVIQPNVEGTRNILQACARAGTRKIIYTSSVAAVGTVVQGNRESNSIAGLNESHWNQRAIEPYARSKTLSEQLAWELATELKLNLVSILPSTMMGPDFQQPTASLQLIEDLLRGKMPMALPMILGYTDVRDVAMAHILAYENPQAQGRYIANTVSLSLLDLCRMVKSLRPQTRVLLREMPIWLARLLPALDYLQHQLSGQPRLMKRAALQEYLGREQRYDSMRLQQELGWTCRDPLESLADTLQWFALRTQQQGIMKAVNSC